MLARLERGDRILRDLLRRMQIMKTDMESAAADDVAALTGVRTTQEFQALEEELKQAHEEVSRLGAELATERSLRAAERESREKAEQSTGTFLGDTKKLQASLSGRDEELKIVHA